MKAAPCIALVVFVAAGVAAQQSAEQNELWKLLRALCGSAYGGKIIETAPYAKALVGRREVIHVRECADDAVGITYQPYMGRARTWVISQNARGLRFRHHDRWVDMGDSSVTEYGGSTRPLDSKSRRIIRAESKLKIARLGPSGSPKAALAAGVIRQAFAAAFAPVY